MEDNELHIFWILAHVGVPENKKTDQPAKGAAIKQPDSMKKLPLTDFYGVLKYKIWNDSEDKLNTSLSSLNQAEYFGLSIYIKLCNMGLSVVY